MQQVYYTGVYYTDSNGRITLDGLKPDTYVITETAAISGYVIDRTPHTIAVKANDTQTLTITNRPRGGLIIMKLSRQTRQPLAGAEFRVVPADESLFTDNEGLTSPNNLYVTDADGQISLSNLTPGAYVITDVIWYERCLSRQNTHITIAAGHLWRMIALCARKAAIPAQQGNLWTKNVQRLPCAEKLR